MLRSIRQFDSKERFFTDIKTLEIIIDLLYNYIDSSFHLVDFSCGTNEFSFMMNKKIGISYESYDICCDQIKEGNFIEKDWFEVKELLTKKESNKIIVGLNPPYGFKYELIIKFIKHTFELTNPEYFALILPYRFKYMNYLKNYETLIKEKMYIKFRNHDTNKITDFQTMFVLLKKNDNISKQTKSVIYKDPKNFIIKRLQKDTNLSHNWLILRIDGRNCCNQWFLYKENQWLQYNKNEIIYTYKKDWYKIGYSIKCFIYIHYLLKADLINIANYLKEQYEKEFGENKGNSTHFHAGLNNIRRWLLDYKV